MSMDLIVIMKQMLNYSQILWKDEAIILIVHLCMDIVKESNEEPPRKRRKLNNTGCVSITGMKAV